MTLRSAYAEWTVFSQGGKKKKEMKGKSICHHGASAGIREWVENICKRLYQTHIFKAREGHCQRKERQSRYISNLRQHEEKSMVNQVSQRASLDSACKKESCVKGARGKRLARKNQ